MVQRSSAQYVAIKHGFVSEEVRVYGSIQTPKILREREHMEHVLNQVLSPPPKWAMGQG